MKKKKIEKLCKRKMTKTTEKKEAKAKKN